MKHNVEAFKKYYINATKEEVIEDMFLDCCEQAKEIERLNKRIEELELDLQDTNSQLADYAKRFIKAIEYIEKKYETLLDDKTEYFLDHDELIDKKRIKHILEILKGEDKE